MGIPNLERSNGWPRTKNIMTDQDRAMKAAIALVFPDSVHRCCKFHVVSKACEKLGWLINSREDFADEFDSCINHTETPEEFEIIWQSLEERYNLHENEAFQNMSVARTMWALAYFRKSFFPFTSTTGRSESMNSLFKRLVHPQDSVLQFVTQYEYIMDTRIEKENLEGCKGQILKPPLWGRYAFEKQAACFYTRSVFFKFQELLRESTSCKKGQVTVEADGASIEILKQVRRCGQLTWETYNVSVQDNATTYSCSCNMFEQDGLLCPHILKVFTSCDVEQIPEKYLLKRWSEEATIKISKNLMSAEPCFGVPATNKLRYNALCKKMSRLAADSCFAPGTYEIVSQGIDKVWEDVKAVGSAASMEVDELPEQGTVNTTMVKNPPAKDRQGRPKKKVER